MKRRVTLNIRIEVDSDHAQAAFAPMVEDALKEWSARRDVRAGQVTNGLQLEHRMDFDSTIVRLVAFLEPPYGKP